MDPSKRSPSPRCEQQARSFMFASHASSSLSLSIASDAASYSLRTSATESRGLTSGDSVCGAGLSISATA